MKRKPNSLISEKSPYLLQHAYNPVNWLSWNNKAFETARNENKPIFLSIGYSACHWCHVMEKESFEDDEVAALLNEYFISIKVDKEERPDIDNVYMNVCRIYTGSGGWPMTIILTPDKEPFYAGTYFPKTERFGRPGMLQLLPQLNEIWRNRHAEVLKSAALITASLKNLHAGTAVVPIDETIIKKAISYFKENYDKEFGGFGVAPKFPTPHIFNFLARRYKRDNDNELLEIIDSSLTQMRLGGVYDHVGFGFHRYSTDRTWLVPHFEKMLYDQALISLAYLDAYLLTNKTIFSKTATEILEYVLQDMTSPEGVFYSAEDADSEGEEGKFYLWTTDDMTSLFDPETAKLATDLYNIKPEGNFFDASAGRTTGENILHQKLATQDLSGALNASEKEIYSLEVPIRKILFEAREKRIHPFKDEKILTDWNGLTIAALCRAGRVLVQKDFVAAAQRAYEFISKNLFNTEGALLHRYKDGNIAVTANADDYSFLIYGLLELYESSFDVYYLEEAIKLNEAFVNDFWDEKEGGFFFTSLRAEKLLVRQKEIYDGAVPSSNSMAMMNLLRLAKLTGNYKLEEKASQIADAFSALISEQPSAYTQFLQAYDFGSGSTTEIIICGEQENKSVKEIIRYLNSIYLPDAVILLKTDRNKERIALSAPFTKGLISKNNDATIYVCNNFKCNTPVFNLQELKKLIELPV
jgi:uncharacterized protein